jgi:hypothetical protein
MSGGCRRDCSRRSGDGAWPDGATLRTDSHHDRGDWRLKPPINADLEFRQPTPRWSRSDVGCRSPTQVTAKSAPDARRLSPRIRKRRIAFGSCTHDASTSPGGFHRAFPDLEEKRRYPRLLNTAATVTCAREAARDRRRDASLSSMRPRRPCLRVPVLAERRRCR